MKKERLTQIALLLVGLFNLALVRFLYRDLWHSNWLLEGKNEIEPMFLSVFVMIGLFLSCNQEAVSASLHDCFHRLVEHRAQHSDDGRNRTIVQTSHPSELR